MELMKSNNEITMKSNELCEMINRFRKEEGNRKELAPHDLFKKINKELESLENAGIQANHGNISVVNYKDKKGEMRPCYLLNRRWILKMCMSESAVVRDKVQDYIEALENRLRNYQLEKALEHKDKEISRLEALIGLRAKDKFQYGKIIKNHLGTKRANADYENIKQMFFFELGVERWEDITYSRDNVKLLKDICDDYKPNLQVSLFDEEMRKEKLKELEDAYKHLKYNIYK